ncbi:MAG: inositol monophosphatase family protein [Myxococcota bacterium]
MTEQDVAIEAARAAAAIQRASRPTGLRQKGAVDWVTDVDLRCEAAIREILGRHTPEIPVLGEEGGGAAGATTRWVVDPLDGTTNYVHGFPFCAVSIGLEVDGVPQVGVVIDTHRDVVFAATTGRGAFANGERLAVSAVDTLDRALCATGFPYDRRNKARFYLKFVEAFLERTQCVRRAGAASLDLAYVAAGAVDLFWEFDLARWDVTAGIVLVREAGGRVSPIPGRDLGDRPCPIATNDRLHDEVVAVIGSILEDP